MMPGTPAVTTPLSAASSGVRTALGAGARAGVAAPAARGLSMRLVRSAAATASTTGVPDARFGRPARTWGLVGPLVLVLGGWDTCFMVSPVVCVGVGEGEGRQVTPDGSGGSPGEDVRGSYRAAWSGRAEGSGMVLLWG